VRSEVQDQPEHRKADASERREKEEAVESHHELVRWAPGTCLGVSCRTPDRSLSRRPRTAPTDHPPTRRSSCGSRIVPMLPWAGLLGKRIDIRTIQVSVNSSASFSRATEPVGSAAS
jgi:hypothetical protein